MWFQNLTHTQFITYTYSQSQCYNPKATCYHTSWIIYISHIINIYMAQHKLYLLTFQYAQLLNYFQNHFNSSQLWLNSSGSHNGPHHNTHRAKLVAFKGSYSCVITQFIAHNTIHISIYMYSIIHHMFNSPHTQNLNHHFISTI